MTFKTPLTGTKRECPTIDAKDIIKPANEILLVFITR